MLDTSRPTPEWVLAAYETGVFPAWKIGAVVSMAFRCEVFDQVGYFDTRLDVGQAGCSGGSEFWYRLLANGFSCRYEPSSVAFHFHRRTMEGLSSQIFHYMRSQQGHCFSGGQRQRLGLARALLRKPQLLILDEAMSALDKDLERRISQAIAERLPNCTVLIISHRAATTSHADHVVYLQGGRVTP